MRLLHSLFSSAAAPAADDIDAARSQLAAAKVERDRRKAALAEATEHLERVQRVLDDAAAADTALEAAEAAAASAAQEWATNNAVGEPDSKAFDAAQQARTVAHRMRLKAQGAEAALPALDRAATEAQSAVQVAEEKIRGAAVAVLVAQAETHFETLEELVPRVAEVVLALRGLRAATSSKLSGFNTGQSAAIAARLSALGFSAPTAHNTDDAVEQAAKEWLRRAQQLVRDITIQ